MMDSLQQFLIDNAEPKTGFLLSAIFGFILYKFVFAKKYEEKVNYTVKDKTDNVVFTDKYDDYKMVLLIRTDLKMGKGKVAAQCAHAAVDAYKSATKIPPILKTWESCGCKKITLKVDSEKELVTYAKDAKAAGLLSVVIRDAGHTQVQPGSKTVCAIGPGPSSLIDKVTGNLKLY